MKQHKAMRRIREFLRHRQHPMMILGYTSRAMWLLLIPLVKYLVALKFDIRSWLVTNWVDILAISAIFAFAVLRWVFIYFEIDEKSMTAHSGYFGLAATRLAFEVVTTVSVHQSSFQRLFGASTLYIDTDAKSVSRADIILVLPKKRAEHILGLITDDSSHGVKYTVESKKRSQLAFSMFFSSTLSGVVIFAGLLFEASRIVDRKIEIIILNTAAGEISKYTQKIPFIIVISALVVIGGWLLSFFANLMRYWHFSVTRQGGRLTVRSGIWTLRHDVMDRDRIYYYDITRSLLMKIFRICTINVYCTGYGKRRSEIPTIAPITTDKEVDKTLSLLMPRFARPKTTLTTGKRELWRFICIPFVVFMFVPVLRQVAVFIFPRWVSEINIISFISSVPCIWLIIVKLAAAFNTGIGFNDKCCVLDYCSFYRFHRVVIKRDKITRVAILQTWAQEKKGYCSVEICTENEKYKKHIIKHLPVDAAMSILRTNGLAV
ncbi:PH domain-containing protein [Ruminococcus sp. NK3A76]|uniref:PH domain-containing protein n=1 Tax=Ruminococcus sp. NK3A76 TaxID=877411 RepID=UPI00068B01CA|nr:PH domain-containing protein [Ruminococcus sp. NK3A76]